MKEALRRLLGSGLPAATPATDAPGAAPTELLAGPTAEPLPPTTEAAEVLRLLDDSDPRVLVEVGSHDGASMSTSNRLITDGWRAVLMEPHPGIFRRLQALHAGNPNVVCLERACAGESGTFPLFIGQDGDNTMLSTLSTDSNPWFDVTRGKETVDVRVDRLTDVLVETEMPTNLGLILVDTEGMDYDVLSGLDFERYRPRIVITEEYIWNDEKHAAKFRLLLDAGYGFYTRIDANTIWLDRRHWSRLLKNMVATQS